MTNIEELEMRLGGLLDTFKYPKEKIKDLNWMKNNIEVKNTGHRDLDEVKKIVVELLKEKNKTRVKNFVK